MVRYASRNEQFFGKVITCVLSVVNVVVLTQVLYSLGVTGVVYVFQVTTMYHLDRPMYLLGYLASQSRVYLIDKEFKYVGSINILVIPPFGKLYRIRWKEYVEK